MTSHHAAAAAAHGMVNLCDEQPIPDKVSIRRALISVYDKTGLVELCGALHAAGVELVSTGGTAKAIQQAGLPVKQVSDLTGFPEILDGRVKTLNPSIHGALLARRNNTAHLKQLGEHSIQSIELVVVNLYPFESAVQQFRQNPSSPSAYDVCIENIDIGGPCMLRAAAKNNAFVTVLSSVNQYSAFTSQLRAMNGSTSYALRKALATAAFTLTAKYDAAISSFLNEVNPPLSSFSDTAATEGPIPAASSNSSAVGSINTTDGTIVRRYKPTHTLKYGCNPHQQPASLCAVADDSSSAVDANAKFPFKIINGAPGYINVLDAVNACQLVFELKRASGGLCAAASFKHVSPTGAAVAVTLKGCIADEDGSIARAMDAQRQQIKQMMGGDAASAAKAVEALTPAAVSYLLARGCDPKCSFGDFCALSDIVDEPTAMVLKTEVSDGIIAPGFTPEALEILKKKKNGGYIILQSDFEFVPPTMEYREIYGVCFAQRRNDASLDMRNCIGEADGSTKARVVTANNKVPLAAKLDLILAAVTAKFTQSNSVTYAKNGQIVGVGAGQQSRIDCVKLAAAKFEIGVCDSTLRRCRCPSRPASRKRSAPTQLCDLLKVASQSKSDRNLTICSLPLCEN